MGSFLLSVTVTLCMTLASALSLPHTDFIKNIMEAIALRDSDNIKDDAYLDVPELIKKYGYPIEIHNVVTEDGYILEMHRIPHSRHTNATSSTRPIVFLMHGLMSSSADWIVMGPGKSLGYILADEGFDVWMGNARGNYYSRKHLTLNPDAILNTSFWKFSWDEIGNIDLPVMIDYALGHTGQSRLHYIGHSQGTTSFFVMTSLRPAYNDKIIAMHAFAPVAYMKNNKTPLLLSIAPYTHYIEIIVSMMGIGEFFPNTLIMTLAGQALCRDEVIFQPLCGNILFLVGGWSENQLNTTMIPVIFGHAPAGASVRQFAHYGQGLIHKDFRRYDQGSLHANIKAYGTIIPPKYDLSRITAPMFFYYSDTDPMAHVKDVDRLWRELGRPVGKFLIPTLSHLDFIWGTDAKKLIYNKVIDLIKSIDVNGLDAIKSS